MPHDALFEAGSIEAEQGMRDGAFSSHHFLWMQFRRGFGRNVEEKRRVSLDD
jgi:hypothetical protein